MKRKGQILNIVLLIEAVVILVLGITIGAGMHAQANKKSDSETEASTETSTAESTGAVTASSDSSVSDGDSDISNWEPLYSQADYDASQIHSDHSFMGDTVKDGELNIVVMGDSIWDHDRGDGNIGELLEQYLQEYYGDMPVHVYNLAIGGTTAAMSTDSSLDTETWGSMSFTGVVYSLLGKLSDEQIDEVFAGQNMLNYVHDVDLSKVDYFIMSYGANDYFCGYPVTSFDRFDLHSYVGALSNGIFSLEQACPDARYVVMTPSFIQFYYYETIENTCLDKYFGDGGTLDKYVGGASVVSLEYNTLLFDAFNDFGLRDTESVRYTKDGTHFNEIGRPIYARNVADRLIEDFDQFQ